MREKFARFMAGRYGVDELNRALSIASCVFLLLWIILRSTGIGFLLWLLWFASIALACVRMLSKNHYKRSEENGKYKRIVYRSNSFARVQKERWVQRREYKFFKCPGCRTTLRVPRGKGKINIVCRKCGNSFRGKT